MPKRMFLLHAFASVLCGAIPLVSPAHVALAQAGTSSRQQRQLAKKQHRRRR